MDHSRLQYKFPFPSATMFTPSLGRLSGSYEDLHRGQVSEALVDFTGGVTMTIIPAEASGNLWDILTRATCSRTLIGCQTHSGVRLDTLAACPLLLLSPLPTSPKTPIQLLLLESSCSNQSSQVEPSGQAKLQ